jgi:hypothetical protein
MERFYKGFSRLQWNDDKSQLAPDLPGKERYALEWEHKAQQHETGGRRDTRASSITLDDLERHWFSCCTAKESHYGDNQGWNYVSGTFFQTKCGQYCRWLSRIKETGQFEHSVERKAIKGEGQIPFWDCSSGTFTVGLTTDSL